MMLQMLQKALISKAIILLDEPVSNTGRLKALITDIGEEFAFGLDIQILRDVDRSLYGSENVITSDSVILDHCVSWVNLAAGIMKEKGKSGIRLWSLEGTVNGAKEESKDPVYREQPHILS